MSQNNCDCGCQGENVVDVPVKGLSLSLDLDALMDGDSIEPGPNGTVLTSQDGELKWEEPAAGEVADYAVGEHWTGARWIDGKKIYRQVVELGTLPNATRKNVGFSVPGLHQMVNLWGISTSSGGFSTFPHPAPTPSS